MKLIFEADMLVPQITNALSILTDRTKVCIDDIHYEKVERTVRIELLRKPITGFKKSLLGEMQPVYGEIMINSYLMIKQVEEMDIEVDDRLISECDSCFTLLFGLKVDDNHLYLGSVEEAQGKSLCQIFIKVRQISIELSDQV
jgi:hypothetical protein